MRESPLTYNVMLSELHKISVRSNGEAVAVCEAQPQFNTGCIQLAGVSQTIKGF